MDLDRQSKNNNQLSDRASDFPYALPRSICLRTIGTSWVPFETWRKAGTFRRFEIKNTAAIHYEQLFSVSNPHEP